MSKLIAAIKAECAWMVWLLLKCEADANTRDTDGQPALMLAIIRDEYKITRMLLDHGADVHTQDSEGNDALLMAIKIADSRIVRLLLQSGANPNVLYKEGRTAFHYMALRDKTTCVPYMFDYGCDPNIRDNDGATPLMYATATGRESAVRMLLEEKNIDPNIQDNDGRTALMRAVGRGDPCIVEIILNAVGVDPNIQDNGGQTVLMLATKYFYMDIIQILLDGGVDVNIRDNYFFIIKIPQNIVKMMNIANLKNIASLYKQEQLRREELIKRALDAKFSMLTIQEFTDVVGFQLSNFLPFDLLWNSFSRGIPIYITNDLVQAFGYKGAIKTQKLSLLKLIKKYNIPIIQLSNDDYREFTGSFQATPNIPQENAENKEENNKNLDFNQLYPQLTKAQLKSRPLHNLIMPRDLKKLLLVVNTENGDAARDFVISLDELFNLYWEYQSAYKSRQLTIKDKKIDILIEKIDKQHSMLIELKEDNEITHGALTDLQNRFEVAADERAPRTRSLATRDRFMIIKINKPNYQWTYYAIRVQHVSLKVTLKKLRLRYPQFTELVSIPYQPNGINFFNLAKEQLGASGNIIFNGNRIKLTVNYTEAQFIQDINNLDMARRDTDEAEE